MNMRIIECLTLAFSLTVAGAFSASAQDYAEYYKYAEEAREMSMLFRGKEGMNYPFVYNGTYYWSQRAFTLGDVFYNGKLYRDIYVNVNAHTQELLVKQSESLMPVVADRDFVDWFTMDSGMFVNLFKRGVPEASEGFYEVLYEGEAALYKRVDKIIRKDANNKNGYAIGYDDPNYNDKVLNYFAYRAQYFFLKDGNWTQVKSISALLSGYPVRKKDIKRYIKSTGISRKDFERLAPLVLKHVEDERD